MGERRLCYGCMEMKLDYHKVCPNCGYADNTPYDPDYIAPGTVLVDRYAVGIKIGHNSEGATYIGYNQSLSSKVLIREYMPQGLCRRVQGRATISVNPEHVVQYKALMEEFKELNKNLAHMRTISHINPTLDLFEANNTTYAVYEYLEGIKLIDYLNENAGELTWKQVSELFPPFFTSLSLIHNQNIVHRAISPETIYVTERGELRLCGFSIPAVRTEDTELPCEMFHGYAAPEQYFPNMRQGTWTDVYGISAVLYRILTGCKPTDAPSRMKSDNLCPPHETNTNVPEHVSMVIMEGLSLSYEKRIRTITELVTRLFEQEQTESIPISQTVPPPKPVQPVHQPHPQKPQAKQQPKQPQKQQNPQKPKQKKPAPETVRYDKEDYIADNHENVIDRIKVPIIITVLLICVLLVIAIIIMNLIDMSSADSTQPTDITMYYAETTDNIVTELVTEKETVQQNLADSQMPNLIAKNFDQVKQQFEADGWIHFEPTYEYSDRYKSGLIISQGVAAGESFKSGSIIPVVVSKGPSKVQLPPFEGKSLAAYEAELEGIGLTNYNTSTVVNYDVENGYVTGLSKAPGEMFDLTGGETLMIYYADNPLPLDSSVQNNNTYVPQPAQTPANRQVVVETQPVPDTPAAPADDSSSEAENPEEPAVDENAGNNDSNTGDTPSNDNAEANNNNAGLFEVSPEQ
ncbi:MAG: PASTA domain-containing protein [Oscillospiraceae bacterium]